MELKRVRIVVLVRVLRARGQRLLGEVVVVGGVCRDVSEPAVRRVLARGTAMRREGAEVGLAPRLIFVVLIVRVVDFGVPVAFPAWARRAIPVMAARSTKLEGFSPDIELCGEETMQKRRKAANRESASGGDYCDATPLKGREASLAVYPRDVVDLTADALE